MSVVFSENSGVCDRLSVSCSWSVVFSGYSGLCDRLTVTYDMSVIFSENNGLCDGLSVTCDSLVISLGTLAYVIVLFNDLRQVSSFLRVLWFI